MGLGVIRSRLTGTPTRGKILSGLSHPHPVGICDCVVLVPRPPSRLNGGANGEVKVVGGDVRTGGSGLPVSVTSRPIVLPGRGDPTTN